MKAGGDNNTAAGRLSSRTAPYNQCTGTSTSSLVCPTTNTSGWGANTYAVAALASTAGSCNGTVACCPESVAASSTCVAC